MMKQIRRRWFLVFLTLILIGCNTTVSAFKERTKYQNQNETFSDLRIYTERK